MFSKIIKELKTLPDHALLNIVREVRDGEWYLQPYIKMIELKNNKLKISFPEVHKDAKATIDLKRTLRIPNDGKTYPLPAGLGNFRYTMWKIFGLNSDDWKRYGGVIFPMYQSEALWINFSNREYP